MAGSRRKILSSLIVLSMVFSLVTVLAPVVSAVDQNDMGTGADAGNSLSAATTIQAGTGTGTGYLDSTDAYDYYKVSVSSGQALRVTMTSPSGANFNLYIYDTNQTQLDSSTNASGTSDSVQGTATASGYLYIKVSLSSGSGAYAMTVRTVASQNDMGTGGDAGRNVTNATYISPGSGTGYIDGDNDDDFYGVYVSSGQTISVAMMSPSTANYDIYIINSSWSWVASSTLGTGLAENASYTAASSGYYYVEVDGGVTAGTYSLTISVAAENAIAPSYTYLSISPYSFTLESGQSTTLTATLYAESGNALIWLASKTITWSATYGSVSPSSSTTNSVGQVSVTYTAPTVTAQTSVTVTASFAADASYQANTATSSGTIYSSGAYIEDFDDAAGMASVGGYWYYSGGTYVLSGEAGMSGLSYSTEIPQTTCDTVSVKFKLTSSSSWQYAGAVLRYDPSTNNGILGFVNQNSTDSYIAVRLCEYLNGAYGNAVDVTPSKISWNTWHTLKVTASGSSYTLYVDDTSYLNFTSTCFTSGRVGVWAFRGSPTYFDNLVVSGTAATAPTTAPTALSVSPSSFIVSSGESKTLTATLTSGGSPLVNKTITWGATAGSFPVTSITTNSSGQASVTYTAPSVTTQTSVTVTASFAGDASYQAIDGSSSGTVTPATITPTTTFYEDFDGETISSLEAQGWKKWYPSTPVPTFAVESGELSLDDPLHAPSGAGLMYLADWSDFTLKFKAKMVSTPGTPAIATITMLFRVSNWAYLSLPRNLYSFSWSRRESTWWLQRGYEGVVTIVASGTKPLIQGVWYDFEVLAYGSSIKIFINGELVVDIVDDGVRSGGMAPTACESHVQFDNVEVIPATITPISTLAVSPSSFALSAGESKTLTATLTSSGLPLAGRAVTWSTSAGSVSPTSGVTDSSGQASVVYTAPTTETIATITASFAGDNQYQSSNGYSYGIVQLPISPTTLTVSPSSFISQPGVATTITAMLTSNGVPLVGKTLTWSATSGSIVPSSGTTDSSGRVVVTYTAPSNETSITATVSFAGDSQYQANSGSFSGTIKAISPIQAVIDIKPETLQIGSAGQWVTCYIELPTDNVSQIDVSSIRLEGTISVDPTAPTEIGDYDDDNVQDLVVKFDRSSVESIVALGPVNLIVTGRAGESTFIGADRIDVIRAGMGALASVGFEVSSGERKVREEVYDQNLELVTEAGDNRVTVTVSSEVSQGTTIVVNVENAALSILSLGELEVRVDNKKIELADNYEDILNVTDENALEYLVLLGAEGIQVLISIPHFSSYTITIEKAAVAAVAPAVAAGISILAIAAIVIGVFMVAFVIVWLRRSTREVSESMERLEASLGRFLRFSTSA